MDTKYATILAQNKDLPLSEIILHDKVQKKRSLTSEEIKYLRDKKLVEGTKRDLHISLKVAKKTELKSKYSIAKGLSNDSYKRMIKEYISQHNILSRKEIDDYLYPFLPQSMNELQKRNKVQNLLAELRKEYVIEHKLFYAWSSRSLLI